MSFYTISPMMFQVCTKTLIKKHAQSHIYRTGWEAAFFQLLIPTAKLPEICIFSIESNNNQPILSP